MIYAGTTLLPLLYVSVHVCVCRFEFMDFSGLAEFRADVFITEAPKLVHDSYLVQYH